MNLNWSLSIVPVFFFKIKSFALIFIRTLSFANFIRMLHHRNAHNKQMCFGSTVSLLLFSLRVWIDHTMRAPSRNYFATIETLEYNVRSRYIFIHTYSNVNTLCCPLFFFVEFFFLQLNSVAIFVYWWVNWNLVLYQNPHNEPISLFSIWILWTTESTQNKNRRINIRRTSFKKLIWILNYFGVYTHTVWHRIYSWTNFTRINQNTAIQNWKYFIFVAV